MPLSIATAGTYSGGSGTADNPYLLSRAADWLELSETQSDWGSDFRLTRSIDFSGVTVKPVGRDFDPANPDYPHIYFSGSLDGGGYRLKNIVLNYPDENDVALFFSMQRASVNNLIIENMEIKAKRQAASLAVYFDESAAKDVKIISRISAEGDAGGLAVDCLNSKFMRCWIGTDIQCTDDNSRAGGIAALAQGEEISFSESIGTIVAKERAGGFFATALDLAIRNSTSFATTQSAIAGGFVGYADKLTVTKSSALIDVRGYNYGGGLAGYAQNSNFFNTFTRGSVSGNNAAGGLVGFCDHNVSFKESFSSVAASSVLGDSGGLAGVLRNSTLTNCYARGQITGVGFVGGIAGSAGQSTLSNCYAAGGLTLFGANRNAGGLLGYADNTSLDFCYWDTEVSGTAYSAGGDGRTTNAMTYPHAVNTYTKWRFGIFWTADTDSTVNDGYPWLRNTPPVALEVTVEGEEPPEGEEAAEGEISEDRYSGGDGTEENPFLISSVEDWQTLCRTQKDWGAHFELTRTLDFTGAEVRSVGWDYDPDNEFHPLPSFTGSLNGNYFHLRNVNLNRPDMNDVALFYSLKGARIQNLFIDNISVDARTYAGALAVYISSSTVSRCLMSGSVQSLDCAGGMATLISGDSQIQSCILQTNVRVRNELNPVGGSAGGITCFTQDTAFLKCSSAGTIVGKTEAGGLTAHSLASSFSECYAHVTVQASVAGGLAASVKDGSFTDCYARGIASGKTYAAGLIAKTDGMVLNNTDNAEINRCFAAVRTRVDGEGGIAAGLIASSTNTNVTASYWDSERSGNNSSVGGERRTTADMSFPYAANSFVGWDFNAVWASDPDYSKNSGYPWLRNLPPTAVILLGDKYSGGEGTAAKPYQIASVADWQQLCRSQEDWTKHFEIIRDLDFTGVIAVPLGRNYNRIHPDHPVPFFQGTLEGNHKRLINLSMPQAEEEDVALFYHLKNAVIRNLNIEQVHIVSGERAAALAVYLEDSTVINCFVSGTISGDAYAGGDRRQNNVPGQPGAEMPGGC